MPGGIQRVESPVERRPFDGFVREVTGVNVHGDAVAGGNGGAGGIIDGDEIERVDIADIVAERFDTPVVVHEAVVFPFDVLQFGVDVAADFGVEAELVGEVFEAPRDIFIACACGDTAVFAVNQRRVGLHVITGVVERGTGICLLDDVGDVLFGARVVVNIEVPGVDVCLDVIIEARRVIFNEARGIEGFGEVIHLAHPFLAFGQLGEVASAESPRFVEHAPGDDGGMVVIAGEGAAQRLLQICLCCGGIGAEVWDIAHEEHAEFICPVIEARFIDFDVETEEVEPEFFGAGDICLYRFVCQEGIDSFWGEGLIERAEEVDGPVVEVNVLVGRVFGCSGCFLDGDFAHAEIGRYPVEHCLIGDEF